MAGRGDIMAGRAFVELFLKNKMTPALTKALLVAKHQLQNVSFAAKFVGQTFNKLSGWALTAGTSITAPFVAALSGLKQGQHIFNQIGRMLASALGKPLLPILRDVRSLVRQFSLWAKQNPELIRTVFKIGVGLTVAGVAFKLLGTAAMMAAGGLSVVAHSFGILAGIVGFIGTPFGAFVALLVGSVAAWAHFTKSGQTAVQHIADLFGDLLDIARETFAGIADALAAGDLKLAAEVAIAGINLAWQKLASEVNKMWADVAFDFRATWQGAITSIAKAFTTMWAVLRQGGAEAAAFAQSSWSRFTVEAVNALNMLRDSLQRADLRALEAMNKISPQDAAKRRAALDAQREAELTKSNVDLDAGQKRAETDRQAALARINEDEQTALKALDEDKKRLMDEMDRARQAGLKEKQTALHDAQEAFNAARDRAVVAAAKAREMRAVPGFPGFGGLDLGGEKPTVTFSGAGLLAAGQGGGGPVQRIAKAAEKHNEKLDVIHKDLIKLADKKVVFE